MAYQFNGTNQNLRVSSSIVSGWPFTMSCFVKSNSLGTTQGAMVVCGDGVDPPYYYMGTRDTSKATTGAFVGGSNSYSISSTTSLDTVNTWHLCSVFYSNNTTSLFVNGTAEGQISHGYSFNSAGVNRFSVGSIDRQAPVAFFNGQIAEPAIWNAALTDAEILSLSRGFTPDQIRPQSLQFYAPLVRDLQDVRGGRTITNVNGATVATHPRIIT